MKKNLLLFTLLLPVIAAFSQIESFTYDRYILSGKDFSELKQIKDLSKLDLSGYELTQMPYGGKLRVKTYAENDVLHFDVFDGITVRYGFLKEGIWYLTQVEGLNKKTVFDSAQKLETDEKEGNFYVFVKDNPVPIIEIIGGKAYFNDIPIPVVENAGEENHDKRHNVLQFEDNVCFYPNPTKGELTISLPNPSEGGAYAVDIYDVAGRYVQQFLIPNSQFVIDLDVSELSSGTYFLKIDDKTYKFVKN
jgi:hypothetical protein